MKKRLIPIVCILICAVLTAVSCLLLLRRPNEALIRPEGMTVETRFAVPEGYERVPVPEGSFAAFLRSLPLRRDRSLVHDYTGKPIINTRHDAVLAWDVPSTDIEQCADVVMHLRAEYLYSSGRYDRIGFHFVSGFYCDFSTWSQGYRVSVNGNDVKWIRSAQPDASRASFEKYLHTVFQYASTLSLEKELLPANKNDLQIGDCFIIAGSPGHVVIIADMIQNVSTGELRFLVLQGNMPSVQAHILQNAEEKALSPWQSALFEGGVFTAPGGWQCPVENLKRFPDA